MGGLVQARVIGFGGQTAGGLDSVAYAGAGRQLVQARVSYFARDFDPHRHGRRTRRQAGGRRQHGRQQQVIGDQADRCCAQTEAEPAHTIWAQASPDGGQHLADDGTTAADR
jgi:hypothetical protein